MLLSLLTLAALAGAGCSGSRGEKLLCGDISDCPADTACSATWVCEEATSARVRARATAVPPEVQVGVAPREGACEPQSLPGSCELHALSDVVFTAPETDGYRFDHWGAADGAAPSSLELCRGTEPKLEIRGLRGNVSCAAYYVRRRVVSGTGAREGLEIEASSGSPHARCEAGRCVVDEGAEVRLTARANGRFVGWRGSAACSSSEPSISLVASADITCTAEHIGRYTITASTRGVEARVLVSASDGTAACEGSSCVVDVNTSVVLVAPPQPGYRFLSWSGDPACVGTQPSLTLVTLERDTACVANYVPRHEVRAASEGAAPSPVISVLSEDAGASCANGRCEIDRGGSVTLLAPTVSGYRLAGWSGDACAGEMGASVQLRDVREDVACVARYVRGVAVMGALVGARGEVIASSASMSADCMSSRCTLDAGADVTLTAPTLADARFLGWEGDMGCRGESLTLVLRAVADSKTCVARYATRVTVQASVLPVAGGSLRASSESPAARCAEGTCELDGQGTVTLDLTLNEGYRLVRWSGDPPCTGMEPRLTLSDLRESVTCTAELAARFLVSASAAPTQGGMVRASSDSAGARCMLSSCVLDSAGDVSLSATPSAGFVFDGWRECSSERAPSITLRAVEQPISCTAAFASVRYAVTGRAATEGGAVEVSSSSPSAQCSAGSCSVDHGAAVTLTASAEPGSRFVGWEGCSSSVEPTLTFSSVRSDLSCLASFAPADLTVTGVAAPSQGGVVEATSDSAGARCQASVCTALSGSSVTLRAVPASGWTFTRWSGCGDGTDATLRLSQLDESARCTANFTRERVEVRGVVVPADVSTVLASSADPSAQCAAAACSVELGSSVLLTVEAVAGLQFMGWTGCTGQQTGLSIRLDAVSADQTCQANFAMPAPRFVVRGEVSPSSAGQVQASAGAMSCSDATCTVEPGASVLLTAPNPQGLTFVNWTGCPDGIQSGRTIELTNVRSNLTCRANFIRPVPTYTVRGLASPAAAGQVAAVTGSLTCGDATCMVESGARVVLTAPDPADFELAGWSGCPDGVRSGRTLALTAVTEDLTCQADFRPRRYTVRATVSPASAGDASASSGGASCADATCSVEAGGSVELTAPTSAGLTFAGWEGCAGVENGLTLTISNVRSDQTCQARFVARTYTVSGVVAPSDAGAVVTARSPGATCSGASCVVEHGGSVVLEVTEPAGQRFTGWTGCAVDDASRPIVTLTGVVADARCQANFAAVTYTVRAIAAPAGLGDVSASVDDMTCADARCNVRPGQTVELTAIELPGRRFVSWSGCDQGVEDGLTLTFDDVRADATCTANFEPRQVSVRASVSPAGAAPTPTLTAAGGATCLADQCSVPVVGGEVTLDAPASSGAYRFSNFSGCGPSTGERRLVVRSPASDLVCTANYVLVTHTATAVALPSELTARLTASTTDGRCSGTSCEVTEGASVSFGAPAVDGYTFAGWTGAGCVGSAATIRVTVGGPIACTANYRRALVSIRGNANPAEAARVGVLDAATGTPCPNDVCMVSPGARVSFRPNSSGATRPWLFTGWTGCPWTAADGTNLTVTAPETDLTCTANYRPAWRIEVSASGGGSAIVRSSSTPRDCSSQALCILPEDASYTLEAGDGEQVFQGWSCDDGVQSSARTFTRTLARNTSCTASFAARLVNVRVRLDPANGSALATAARVPANPNASCTTDACTVTPGESVELAAVARTAGWTFDRWSGCSIASQETSPTQSYARITAGQGDVECVAHFRNAWEVVATAGEGGRVDAVARPAGRCERVEDNDTKCVVDHDGSVEFTATANDGWEFAAWSDSCPFASLSANPAVLSGVQRPYNCSASFRRRLVNFSAYTNIGSSGEVRITTSDPAVQCAGGQCTVQPGTRISMTPVYTQSYYIFSHWQGCQPTDQGNLTFTISPTSDTDCTAIFALAGSIGVGGSTPFNVVRMTPQADMLSSCIGGGANGTSCIVQGGANVTLSIDGDPGLFSFWRCDDGMNSSASVGITWTRPVVTGRHVSCQAVYGTLD